MAAPIFVAGDVPTDVQVDEYMVNIRYVTKTADETITSSTALQDDNHLTLPVLANATYLITVNLQTTNTATAAGIGWTVTGPAGASIFGQAIGPQDGATAAGAPIQSWLGTIGATISHGCYVGSVSTLTGQLIIGGTAGSALVRWAQLHSNGTGTTVKTGSHMSLYRVA